MSIVSDEECQGKSQCGLFGCRPKFLQPYNKPLSFLILFSMSSFWMMLSVGVNAIMAPTLESLFNISSTQMGFIFTANDLSGVIAALFLGNFCASRKIRWITFGLFTFGFAGLVTASAQFFVKLPEIRSAGGNNTVDHYAVENNRLYWMHIAGALMQGVGLTPPGISGTTYMDEIFTQRIFGVAVAVLALIALLGFPVSYILGTYFLKMHVTLSTVTGINSDHPKWIGAWWMGYFVPGVILITLAIPISLFPQQMPAAQDVLKKKIKRGLTSLEEKSHELNRSVKEIMKDIGPVMQRLGRNISFDFMLAGDTLMFLYYGSLPFWPKLYGILFRINTDVVGNMLGYSKIISFVAGLTIGGVMVWLREYTGRQATLLTAICGLLSTPFVFGILMYCPLETRVGVDVPYPSASVPSLLDQCQHSSVPCDTTFLSPICSKGLTYLSPCHAGCVVTADNITGQRYENCSCIPSGQAEEGGCGKECSSRLLTSIVLQSIGYLIALMSVPAHNIVNMRIVSEVDRTVAQGVRQFGTRIAGTLPAPLLFGAIIDSYCTVWRYTDGVRGNCWVYDVEGLLITYTIMQFTIRFLSALCHFACWWWYPEIKSSYEEVRLSQGESLGSINGKQAEADHGYMKLPVYPRCTVERNTAC